MEEQQKATRKRTSRALRPAQQPNEITTDDTPFVPDLSNLGEVVQKEEPETSIKEEPETATDAVNDLPVKVINLDPAVVKFDINQKQIDEYKELVPTLTIKDANDSEGYAKVYSTRQLLKRARTTLEKKRKDIVEDANKFVTSVNSQAREYRQQLEELEEPLQKLENWYDSEKERIRLEKEQAETKLIQDRTAALIAVGCTYHENGDFTLNQFRLSNEELKTLPAPEFDNLMEGLQLAHDEEIKAKQQQEEETIRKQQELEQKQREFEKQQKQFREKEIEFRKYMLATIGFAPTGINGEFIHRDSGLEYTIDEIYNLGATEWQQSYSNSMVAIQKFKNEQEKKQKEQEAENKRAATLEIRRAQLEAIGVIYDTEDESNYYFKTGIVGKSPGIIISKAIYHTDMEAVWTNHYNSTKELVESWKKELQQQALKAEQRRGDLRSEGLTSWEGSFVYRGTHVFKVFVPDTEEALLKRDDEWWTNKTLPGVKEQVASLKLADENEITRLLTEENQRKEQAKSDVERLQTLNAEVYSIQSRALPTLLSDKGAAAIHSVRGKLQDCIDLLEATIKELS